MASTGWGTAAWYAKRDLSYDRVVRYISRNGKGGYAGQYSLKAQLLPGDGTRALVPVAFARWDTLVHLSAPYSGGRNKGKRG